MSQLLKAIRFATIAHGQQTRKYTGEPYIEHPLAVMRLIKNQSAYYDDDMLLAAVLHDTVEDTEVNLFDISVFFGSEVHELVYWLTDASLGRSDLNRAARKKMDREHLAKAPPEAQTIKLADMIHNTQSIVKHDPNFAKVYMKEKEFLLQVMDKGDFILLEKADLMIKDYKEGRFK